MSAFSIARSTERPAPDLFRLIFLLGHSLGHAHFCSAVQRDRAVFLSIRSLSSSFKVRTIGSGFVSPVRSYAAFACGASIQ
nr:unnamed protein product [Spirometra erinaceieuropaei]